MTESHLAHGPYFSDDEWEHLQAADRRAAREVVSLLVGVFTTGVVLYSIVAFVAMAGPVMMPN